MPNTGRVSANAMRANSAFCTVAKANDFLVVCTEGTNFGNERQACNTGFQIRRQVQNADDPAFFGTLIDSLANKLGADPTGTNTTGGSNGVMITSDYAVHRPERRDCNKPITSTSGAEHIWKFLRV